MRIFQKFRAFWRRCLIWLFFKTPKRRWPFGSLGSEKFRAKMTQRLCSEGSSVRPVFSDHHADSTLSSQFHLLREVIPRSRACASNWGKCKNQEACESDVIFLLCGRADPGCNASEIHFGLNFFEKNLLPFRWADPSPALFIHLFS